MTDHSLILEKAKAALSESLGGALDCTRSWEAWSVGTMTEHDFVDVNSDDARLQEILDATCAPFIEQIEQCNRLISMYEEMLMTPNKSN